jgi:osmoprotectant transport system ATP-binding protein
VSAIAVEELTVRFGATVAVDRVSFEVEEGELLVLIGASGSGKTTTLKTLNRLVEPTSGRVLLHGRDARDLEPAALRRRVGYCFQRIGLFPHLTVGENVAITPRLLGWPRDRIEARVEELLTLMRLDPGTYRDRFPSALSGGQQQRVGVARALAAEAKLVLFDEPFGALDPLTREELQEELRQLKARLRLTGVFVTHDMLEAMTLGDRIAVMKDGRLLQHDTPEGLLAAPADPYVEELVATPRRHYERVAHLLSR